MGDIGTGEDTAVGRSLRLSSRSGRIEVVAEERHDIVVEKRGEVLPLDAPVDGRITVTSRSSNLTARVPLGTDVVVGTTSGRVELRGDLGSVAVTSMSGRVKVEAARQVGLRSTSSRVSVARCQGEARIDTFSGRIEVGHAGAARLSTVTGRIAVDSVEGMLRARTVSGRVHAALTGDEVDVRLETMSGRVDLVVPNGARPAHEFSSKRGQVRSSVPEGSNGLIRARTVSGGINITEV
ncbi:MAG: DUF4097 family beta strand repeat protein [Acidimicrobiia bacterium]|nr:DUF4097 family beta strand repeat protein [Acidimicrobiia bacterium]